MNKTCIWRKIWIRGIFKSKLGFHFCREASVTQTIWHSFFVLGFQSSWKSLLLLNLGRMRTRSSYCSSSAVMTDPSNLICLEMQNSFWFNFTTYLMYLYPSVCMSQILCVSLSLPCMFPPFCVSLGPMCFCPSPPVCMNGQFIKEYEIGQWKIQRPYNDITGKIFFIIYNWYYNL